MLRARLVLPLAVLSAIPSPAAPLDTAALDDAFAKAQREAAVCFTEAAAGRELIGGEVSLRAVIGPTGEVAEATVTDSTVSRPDRLACVVEAVERVRVERPGGGGFMPTNRTFLFWNPPEGAPPVRVNPARRLVQRGLPALETCLGSARQGPDRLDVQVLVGEGRVHPVTGGMPSEWARCVRRTYSGARLRGVGAVNAALSFDQEGVASIDRVESRAAADKEVQTWTGELRAGG